MAQTQFEDATETSQSVVHLRSALMNGKVPDGTVFHMLAEVIHDYPNCTEELLRHAAETVCTGEWEIENEKQVIAAARLFPYVMPEAIHIFLKIPLSKAFGLKNLLMQVRTRFTGSLYLCFKSSYVAYTACDELVMLLKGASCEIGEFVGCLSTRAALLVLSSMATAYVEMWVSVSDVINHDLGNMAANGDVPLLISYQVKYQSCSAIPRQRPLPLDITGVIVDCIPSSGVSDAAALILAIASECNEIWMLRLRQCLLSNAELEKLLYSLYAGGLRTQQDDENCRITQMCPSDGDLCRLEEKMCNDPNFPERRCVYIEIGDNEPVLGKCLDLS